MQYIVEQFAFNTKDIVAVAEYSSLKEAQDKLQYLMKTTSRDEYYYYISCTLENV